MNIFICYHSQTGTTHLLAKSIAEGVESKQGAHAFLRRIEKIPGEVNPSELHLDYPLQDGEEEALESASNDYATVDPVDVEELYDTTDALVVGSPVYWGNMSAATKLFIEQLTPLWQKDALIDKPAGAFVTSGSLHGGKEFAITSILNSLMPYGMIPIGLPFQESYMRKFGTIYGPTATGMPTKENKSLARLFGRRIADITFLLQYGRPESKNTTD